jgi:hypothetical protein
VFVKAGGVVPEETPSAGSAVTARHLVLKIFSGSNGSFDLYGDSGTGLGYTKGQHTQTSITDVFGAASKPGAVPITRVRIDAARGHYRSEPSSVSYQLDLIDLTAPSQVELDGRKLAKLGSASARPGWYYDASTDTVVVNTSALSVSEPQTLTVRGGGPVQLHEPQAGGS